MKRNTLMFLFLILIGAVFGPGAVSAADLNLTGALSGVYYNVGKINVQGTCTVASGVSATCAATQGITFYPGFRALSGSTFRAVSDTGTDSDEDGLADVQERYVYITNPTNPDTDGDGMPDGWEVENSLNPKVDDADGDADGDGASNYWEYQAETDPNDSGDRPGYNAYEYDALGRIKSIIRN